MRSLSGSCLKYLLFVCNIICFVYSIQLITFGIVVTVTDYTSMNRAMFISSPTNYGLFSSNPTNYGLFSSSSTNYRLISSSSITYGRFSSISNNFIVGGLILCVTSCLACWGAVSENLHMLITSTVLESILVLVNMVLLVIIYAIKYYHPFFGPHAFAIILGVTAFIKIIGIVLASFMASIIRAESHCIQTREALELKIT